jgi:hypothetical protein
MFSRLFGSPKKRRADAIMKSLIAKAVVPVATPSFKTNSAVIRAYIVGLGITVPEHVSRAAFPDKIYPPWDDVIWRKDDSIFDDLAALLAWSQCFTTTSAFEDLFRPEEHARVHGTLMRVCKATFPRSERAARLIQRYLSFMTERSARQELVDKRYIGSKYATEEPCIVEIHAWMVNETLGQPDLDIYSNPSAVVGLQLYLSRLDVDATGYFIKRAREIFAGHIAAGLP